MLWLRAYLWLEMCLCGGFTYLESSVGMCVCVCVCGWVGVRVCVCRWVGDVCMHVDVNV